MHHWLRGDGRPCTSMPVSMSHDINDLHPLKQRTLWYQKAPRLSPHVSSPLSWPPFLLVFALSASEATLRVCQQGPSDNPPDDAAC